jgi:signal transduction histidine kinase
MDHAGIDLRESTRWPPTSARRIGAAADRRSDERDGEERRSRDRHSQVQALEVISDLLLGIGEGSPPDAFFSSLCEAICRLASMRRAILFRYDSVRRRVRAVGAHNLDLDRFSDLFVTVDSVPIAREALAEDRVLEVVGAEDFDIPASLRELLAGALIVCTPMAAAGRHVGVVFSERDPACPQISDEERHLLWTLGKAIAMASVARSATAYGERNRQLQHRIDLAREIHEGVVQRLFGVSLVLSAEERLDDDAQRRCAEEVHAALGELRAALQRPLGRSSPPTALTFEEELHRLRGLHPEIELRLEGQPQQVPPQLQALSQSILVEAVRNAVKHAQVRRIDVRIASADGAFTLDIRNDGAATATSARSGIGLRLATLEALQHGGVLEFGECERGVWQVRLVAPSEIERAGAAKRSASTAQA